MLETALASGVCSMGGRVLLCGPIPTPAVARLTVSMRADAGIVISASHNPYADNGIKVFGADGFKLPDEAELEMEALMADAERLGARKTGPGIGRAEKLEAARGRYVAYVKATFPRDLSLDGVGPGLSARALTRSSPLRLVPMCEPDDFASVAALPGGVERRCRGAIGGAKVRDGRPRRCGLTAEPPFYYLRSTSELPRKVSANSIERRGPAFRTPPPILQPTHAGFPWTSTAHG